MRTCTPCTVHATAAGAAADGRSDARDRAELAGRACGGTRQRMQRITRPLLHPPSDATAAARVVIAGGTAALVGAVAIAVAEPAGARASPPSACSPVTGAAMQLIQVQVAFRHGARLPNHDVVHPGESATGVAADIVPHPRAHTHGNFGQRLAAWVWPPRRDAAVWTAADTALDPAKFAMRFVLHDYKGHELEGNAANKRISHGRTVLGGGGQAGKLSTVGWEQTVRLGERLRERYLAVDGAKFTKTVLGSGLTHEEVLVRTTPVGRSVTSAQGVLTGLFPSLPGGTCALIRLNRGPQWMVYNNFQCPLLASFFRAAVKTDGPRSNGEECQRVMEQVAQATGLSLDPILGAARDPVAGAGGGAMWQASALSVAEQLLRYHDAVACRIGDGRPLPEGMNAGLWTQVDVAATRTICTAFRGGAGASAETSQLALRLAVGRMLEHVLQVCS